MPIEFINPLTDARYEQFIASNPDTTVFHSRVWIKALEETYGFIPGCAAVIDARSIAGAVPFMETCSITGKKRCVSLPFSDFCIPLFKSEIEFNDAFHFLVEKAEKEKWHYIEIRGGEQFFQHMQCTDEIVTHEIVLDKDERKLLHLCRDSTRRNIRKAKSAGVTVVHDTSIEAMRSFYYLNCLTRKKHGIPPQPWLFFKHLWINIINKGNGFITLATFENRAIAANLFLVFNEVGLFKYGAMDKKYGSLRPSNLTMWEGIKKCREIGCRRVNLGRTEIHHSGLLQFKRGFGCSEKTIKYFRYDCRKREFSKKPAIRSLPFAISLFSLIPLPLLRSFGKYMYRYAG
ncbi:MAG: peptidoglycan bridge formation glycyltransferase FemA/FemB family protein [Candidatus Latescibacteria bacterium]|nr:peptidoglycan bridge formation glycyltransferase FemA/FemB family protein [Candidatus Latescibacterota bacterium]